MGVLAGLGPWGLVVALVIGLGAGGTAAWEIKAGKDAGDAAIAAKTLASVKQQLSDCGLARERDRADRNQKTVDGLEQSMRDALAENDRNQAALAAQQVRFADFMGKLHALPVTRACAASPAMRLLFDSVRNEAAAAGNPNGSGVSGSSANDLSRQSRGTSH